MGALETHPMILTKFMDSWHFGAWDVLGRGPIPNYEVTSCHRRYICGLSTLWPSGNFIADALPFLQTTKSFRTNRTEMRKHIRASVFRSNEPKTFCIVKPFYCSVRHIAVDLV